MERGEAVVERDESILYDACVPLTCVWGYCVCICMGTHVKLALCMMHLSLCTCCPLLSMSTLLQ